MTRQLRIAAYASLILILFTFIVATYRPGEINDCQQYHCPFASSYPKQFHTSTDTLIDFVERIGVVNLFNNPRLLAHLEAHREGTSDIHHDDPDLDRLILALYARTYPGQHLSSLLIRRSLNISEVRSPRTTSFIHLLAATEGLEAFRLTNDLPLPLDTILTRADYHLSAAMDQWPVSPYCQLVAGLIDLEELRFSLAHPHDASWNRPALLRQGDASLRRAVQLELFQATHPPKSLQRSLLTTPLSSPGVLLTNLTATLSSSSDSTLCQRLANELDNLVDLHTSGFMLGLDCPGCVSNRASCTYITALDRVYKNLPLTPLDMERRAAVQLSIAEHIAAAHTQDIASHRQELLRRLGQMHRSLKGLDHVDEVFTRYVFEQSHWFRAAGLTTDAGLRDSLGYPISERARQ